MRTKVLIGMSGLALLAAGLGIGRATASDPPAPRPLPEICEQTMDVADRVSSEAVDAAALARTAVDDAPGNRPTTADLDKLLASVKTLSTHLDALVRECRTEFKAAHTISD